ncbi:MAG: CCA tRNA nucleotidyltransferase [Oscillospiraceae bacterium]|nr:CCA tRNA nucleotidyltransferase [Oscillospiraceae bacterium]
MYLPDWVLYCVHSLEQAGFQAYTVGGCVRDSLLGLQPHDYDLCTSATPQQTAQVFSHHTLIRSGEKHGTIGVVVQGQVLEITTFRTEGGYRDSRHPDWVEFVDRVQEDLARRDFTVNAIAYHPEIGYVDPFGGQQDLQNRVLRAVGDAPTRFREDALRILRGVRFSVRFGLTPAPATMAAMAELAPLMEQLAKERIFQELCGLLPLIHADELVTFAPILVQVLPVLKPCVGFLQHSIHHQYDVFTHTAYVVEATPEDLSLRWAALLHDCGKPAVFSLDESGKGHFKGHAKISAQLAEETLYQLKAPTALREQVVFLVAQHMTPLEPDKKLLRRRLGKWGVAQTQALLQLQEADMGSKGTGDFSQLEQFSHLRQLLQEVLSEDACLNIRDLAINGNHLLELGFAPGKAIGNCLQYLLSQVQQELLPNEPGALLAQALDYLTHGMNHL